MWKRKWLNSICKAALRAVMLSAALLSAIMVFMPAARAADMVEQMRIWNEPLEGFRVVGNIYYVGTRRLSAFLITTADGHVLIDGATKDSPALIEANIRRLGFKPRDVRYLLNSHAHLDHSGGLAKLKQDTGAQLVASEGDRSALEGGFYLGWEQRHEFDAPSVKVDRIIGDGDTLHIGGTQLTALITPGHTRGCTSWKLRVVEEGKPLDVLYVCSTSVAFNRIAPPLQYPGIVEDYERSFARLKGINVDVFLAPHAEMFGLVAKLDATRRGGTNPFINAKEFPAYLLDSERDFRLQLGKQRSTPR